MINWSQLYRQWHPCCMRWAFELLKDKHQAADVVQDVFLHLLEKKLQPGFVQHMGAFLKKSVRHKAIDYVRKKERLRQVELHLSTPDNATMEYIQYRDAGRQYEHAIQSLPQKGKRAYVMHVKDGLSKKEVAALMGIGVETAADHIRQSKDKMRRRLSWLRA